MCLRRRNSHMDCRNCTLPTRMWDDYEHPNSQSQPQFYDNRSITSSLVSNSDDDTPRLTSASGSRPNTGAKMSTYRYPRRDPNVAVSHLLACASQNHFGIN